MSKTVKLFSQNRRTVGTTSTLPVIGRVTFDKEQNFIEVDEEQITELRKHDFGIVLLTAEEIKANATKKKEVKTPTPTTPPPPSGDPLELEVALELLKAGRSEDDQLLLTDFISQVKVYKETGTTGQLTEEEKLKLLPQEEIDTLLSGYPNNQTKGLKTPEAKIAFLIEKLKDTTK